MKKQNKTKKSKYFFNFVCTLLFCVAFIYGAVIDNITILIISGFSLLHINLEFNYLFLKDKIEEIKGGQNES